MDITTDRALPSHESVHTPQGEALARPGLPRLDLPSLLPDPVMATAMDDGNGPLAVLAPASETDALTMVRPLAALNTIPADPGPKSTSTLPRRKRGDERGR